MQCSGCGKNIPFNGSVCPFCQRDKSEDKATTALAMAMGIGFAVLGGLIIGVWGFVGGFVGGCVIAIIVRGAGVTKPPEVRVTNFVVSPSGNERTDEKRLLKIKDMFDKGLINEAEYIQTKREILNTF